MSMLNGRRPTVDNNDPHNIALLEAYDNWHKTKSEGSVYTDDSDSD